MTKANSSEIKAQGKDDNEDEVKKEYHISESKKSEKKGMPTIAKVGIGLGIGCIVVIVGITGVAWFIYKNAVNKVTDEFEKLESFQDFSEEYQYNPPQPGELYNEITEEEDLVEVKGSINDTLSDGEVEIKINSVNQKSSIKDLKPYKDNEYWVLNATIKNVSKEDINLFTSNFTIQDENENSYYIAYLGEDTLNDSIPTWHYLPQGEKISGNIILEVRKDLNNLKIFHAGQKMLIYKLENKK